MSHVNLEGAKSLRKKAIFSTKKLEKLIKKVLRKGLYDSFLKKRRIAALFFKFIYV